MWLEGMSYACGLDSEESFFRRKLRPPADTHTLLPAQFTTRKGLQLAAQPFSPVSNSAGWSGSENWLHFFTSSLSTSPSGTSPGSRWHKELMILYNENLEACMLIPS